MSITTTGIVTNRIVVPSSPLPEGAHVEIRPKEATAASDTPLSPRELRALPRDMRQAVLALAAKKAEEDYRNDRELTGFAAFHEEELDDDDTEFLPG